MCNECRQHPCHASCYNSDEPVVVYRCEICGRKIYEGDTYYDINKNAWCKRCVEVTEETAVREGYC